MGGYRVDCDSTSSLKIIFLQLILSFQQNTFDSIDNTSYNTLLEMRHLTGF